MAKATRERQAHLSAGTPRPRSLQVGQPSLGPAQERLRAQVTHKQVARDCVGYNREEGNDGHGGGGLWAKLHRQKALEIGCTLRKH